MKELYYKVKEKQDTDNFNQEKNTLKSIENDFYSKAITKQILFSDWYAHYKFFWQWRTHIAWMEKELDLTLLANKIPLSFIVSIVLMLILIIYLLSNSYCCTEVIQSMGEHFIE